MADIVVSFTQESDHMTNRKKEYQKVFYKEKTMRVPVVLHVVNDADIIAYLETVDSKAGAFKQAIREQIKKEGANNGN